MSIIVTQAPAVIQSTIPAAMKKQFTGAKFEAIVNGLVPFEASELVKPSNIKSTRELARTGMGAKSTPQSFVNGLLFLTTAFAWGQGKLDALSEGMPPAGVYALRTSTEHLKNGAGIDAGTLRHAVLHAMSSLMGLPLKAKAEKPQAPAIASTAVRVEEEKPQAPAINPMAEVIHLQRAHDALWAGYGDALRDGMNAAKQQARTEADSPAFVELFATLAKDHEEQALAMLKTMAESMGYTLRKAPAKKAA